MKGFALVHLLVQSLTAILCSKSTLMGSDKDFFLAVQVMAETGADTECIQNPDRSIVHVTGIRPIKLLGNLFLCIFPILVKCWNWVISNGAQVWLNYAKD